MIFPTPDLVSLQGLLCFPEYCGAPLTFTAVLGSLTGIKPRRTHQRTNLAVS